MLEVRDEVDVLEGCSPPGSRFVLLDSQIEKNSRVQEETDHLRRRTRIPKQ